MLSTDASSPSVTYYRDYMNTSTPPKKRGYAALYNDFLNWPTVTRLPPRAKGLLLDLAAQYHGNNNGDLTAAWSKMRKRGWRTERVMRAALKELLVAGVLIETRPSRKVASSTKPLCALYACTLWPVNACNKGLTVEPTTEAPDTWKQPAATAAEAVAPQSPELTPQVTEQETPEAPQVTTTPDTPTATATATEETEMQPGAMRDKMAELIAKSKAKQAAATASGQTPTSSPTRKPYVAPQSARAVTSAVTVRPTLAKVKESHRLVPENPKDATTF